MNDVANDRRWPTVMKKLPAAGIGTYCSVPLTAGEPLERVAAEQYRTLHRQAAAAIGEIAEAASGGGMAPLTL